MSFIGNKDEYANTEVLIAPGENRISRTVQLVAPYRIKINR